MNRFTPMLIIAITFIVLLAGSCWIIATAYYAGIERRQNVAMCVTESGHKKVPCP